jgi:hypothetical protein
MLHAAMPVDDRPADADVICGFWPPIDPDPAQNSSYIPRGESRINCQWGRPGLRAHLDGIQLLPRVVAPQSAARRKGQTPAAHFARGLAAPTPASSISAPDIANCVADVRRTCGVYGCGAGQTRP